MASAPKTSTPASRVGAGCRTMRPATRLQTPVEAVVWMLHGMSFSRPNRRANSRRLASMTDSLIDSRAGSSVSPAASMTPMPMASGMPSWE